MYNPEIPKKYSVVIYMFAFLLLNLPICADEFYNKPQIYGMRPNPKGERDLGPIGVTGVMARIYRGLKLTVEGTEPGSPAAGKFNKGDIILGVNGVKLKGKNMLVVLGKALTKAEATDGKLTFEIKQAKGGGVKQVSITIPVLGTYSNTFPLKCEKSTKIIKQAADFYSGKERLKGYNMWNALACLYLLSTGDDAYVSRVKEYFSQFLTPSGKVKGIGDHSWFNGYNGVACAEYYLRTGDKSVLPILQYLCDDARDRQRYGVGWGHWGYNANPAYESGGGMQHAAGNQILLTLVLGKMCGVNVDEKTLTGALRHWYRFAGHGAIPIADQRYWHIFRSAGRDGATAAVMHVAAQAEGDVTIYKKANEYLAMSALTSWPSRNYDWEVYWHSLSGQFMLDYNSKMYYDTMKRFQWCYDLGRYPSGGFAWPHNSGSKDPTESGIALALAYSAPLRKLCITGAPRSKYAVDFKMPETLWGTKADLEFLTSEHNKDFFKYGEDEEIHIPYWKLPTRLRYSPGEVKNLDLNMMLKNVRHARCEIRMAAAKALCMNGQYGELEKLLTDPDPRLRRAGLDGINDCRPWFTGPPVGKYALPAEKFTSAMKKAITKMMNDPKESWFVIDGALQALSHAPTDLIDKNFSKIIPWTKHDEWWLRESAFFALMGFEKDEKLFVKHLPAILKLMTNEYRYNPRHKMLKSLEKALVKSKEGSKVRELIAKGFAKATTESKVLPNKGKYTRSKEGATNIIEVTLASVKNAPKGAPELAESLAKSGRIANFETDSIIKIVETHDNHASGGVVGLYPSLKTLSETEKKRVTDVLFSTFRPELLKRLNTEKKANPALINLLVKLNQLKSDSAGWETLGKPEKDKRVWRYRTYDAPENEKMHPRIGPPKRLRKTTLPKDMVNWATPEYDDSSWEKGLTPIGKGVFKAYGHGKGHASSPDFCYKSKSKWGEGEFIAMRTKFNLTDKDLKKDYYGIRILCPQGYHIYLNGKKIHTYVWFHNVPKYHQIILGPNETKHFRKGENTLAVQSVLRYAKDRNSEAYKELGQVDIFIEALKKSDLGL